MHCTCIQGPIIHAKVSKPGPDMGPDRPVQRNVSTTLSPEIFISVCWLLTAAVRGLFSVLSRVKNEIRITVSDKRLNALCLMAIENNEKLRPQSWFWVCY